MTEAQRLWWLQAQSDYSIFEMLRGKGVNPCHPLHYLQMSTEKLAKASFWSSGTPPPSMHTGFAAMLRRFGSVPAHKQAVVLNVFEFNTYEGYQAYLRAAIPLARAIEQVSPNVVKDSVNSEYPWPHADPKHCPVEWNFDVWEQLELSHGRKLMRFISNALNAFSRIATL